MRGQNRRRPESRACGRNVSAACARVKDSARLASNAETSALRVRAVGRAAAEKIAAGMHPAMCTRERSLHLSSFHLICVAIVVAAVALVALLVPVRRKPKVN